MEEKKLAKTIAGIVFAIAIIGIAAIVVYWLGKIHWTVPAFVGCLSVVWTSEKYLDL